MKNFDEGRRSRQRSQEERTFVLGGEQFVVRRTIRPDDVAAFDQLGALGPNPPITEVMQLIDELFKTLIERGDDSHARYDRIRAVDEGEDVIDTETLREVVEWMIEVATGRPIPKPSDSTPGGSPPATSSTGGSSSQGLKVA